RRIVPPSELAGLIDNLGVPYSGLNLSYSNSAPVGPADADILISMKEGHRPTADVIRAIRTRVVRDFPVVMVSQILNFGLPAPIDVQVIGNNLLANRAFAEKLMDRIRYVPGTVDL